MRRNTDETSQLWFKVIFTRISNEEQIRVSPGFVQRYPDFDLVIEKVTFNNPGSPCRARFTRARFWDRRTVPETIEWDIFSSATAFDDEVAEISVNWQSRHEEGEGNRCRVVNDISNGIITFNLESLIYGFNLVNEENIVIIGRLVARNHQLSQ